MADALSRLDCQYDIPQKEALITDEMCSNWYVYAKEEKSFDSHPLSYGQLETAQKADKEVMKILKKDDSVYKLHDIHGGGGLLSN